MWSSALEAQSPQGWACCTFWDAFLVTTVVKGGSLNYWSLPVSLNQSSLWPLSWTTHRTSTQWRFLVLEACVKGKEMTLDFSFDRGYQVGIRGDNFSQMVHHPKPDSFCWKRSASPVKLCWNCFHWDKDTFLPVGFGVQPSTDNFCSVQRSSKSEAAIISPWELNPTLAGLAASDW